MQSAPPAREVPLQQPEVAGVPPVAHARAAIAVPAPHLPGLPAPVLYTRFTLYLTRPKLFMLVAYLLVSLMVSAALLLLPQEVAGDVSNWLTLGTAFASVAICAAAARRASGTGMAVTLMAATGFLALYASAEAVWAYYPMFLNDEAPLPSVADALWYAGYVPLYMMLATVVLRFGDQLTSRHYLMVMVGAFMALVLLILPLTFAVATRESDPIGAVVLLGYPAADIGTLALCALIFFIYSRSLIRYYWSLMGWAIAVFSIGDILFALMSAYDIYYNGSLPDVLFIYSYFVFSAGFAMVLSDAAMLRKLSPAASYRIEQVYVLTSGGRVVYHWARPVGGDPMDKDLVGGMMVAVERLVRECFSTLRPRKSSSLFFGNFEIAIEHSGNLTMMMVLLGKSSGDLRRRAGEALHAVEEKHGAELKEWSGDQSLTVPISQTLAASIGVDWS